jgi:hypothetical protein
MNVALTAPRFQVVSSAELDQAGSGLEWLWHGYLARGMITLLTSRAKSGKTTLLSILLKRLETGGELAGLPVRPGRALVVSEEDPLHWRPRHARLRFGDGLCFVHRPFGTRTPQPDEWDALLDHILDHQARRGLDLAVIDTIGHFLPTKSEAEATCMLNALRPLTRLTAAGLAVLLLHHPSKHARENELAARGSSALVGFVDVLVDMHFYTQGDAADRRRKLVAHSRSEDTAPRLVIELDQAGAAYRSLGTFEEAKQRGDWAVLQPVLAAAAGKLTLRQICRALPEPRPAKVTVYRWLKQAVQAGLLHQDGGSGKFDPRRYWLPGADPGRSEPGPADASTE